MIQQCQSVVNNIVNILSQDHRTHGMSFDLTVINANAFVLPNGKIFIYTGLFNMVENKAGLALVLGHECSHAIYRTMVLLNIIIQVTVQIIIIPLTFVSARRNICSRSNY